MIWRFNLLIVTFLTSQFVQAQNKIGNGGNVVSCASPNNSKIELLDFYEHDVSPTSKIIGVKEIASEAINHIKVAAPKLAAQYQKRLDTIFDDIEFKDNVDLTDVPDSKHLFKPVDKNCEIKQIAVRKKQIISDEKRFIIRKDLWEKLSDIQKAGLITHEIIYEHFMKLGEENSIKARRLNAKIYEGEISTKDFWKFIKELEVRIYP